MQIPDGHAGEIWTDVLGWSQGEITIGDDVSLYLPSQYNFNFNTDTKICQFQGWTDFRCPARSVSVWAKKDARGREEFVKKDEQIVSFTVQKSSFLQ